MKSGGPGGARGRASLKRYLLHWVSKHWQAFFRAEEGPSESTAMKMGYQRIGKLGAQFSPL